jgi:hypothetical protein
MAEETYKCEVIAYAAISARRSELDDLKLKRKRPVFQMQH